jgi:hypothetical protein
MDTDLLELGGSFWSTYADPFWQNFILASHAIAAQHAADRRSLQLCRELTTTPLHRHVRAWPIRTDQDGQAALPDGTVAVRRLTSRLIDPTDDLPFRLVDGVLHADPVTELLWAHDLKVDHRWLEHLWGVPVGVRSVSTDGYRRLLVAVYDAIRNGTTVGTYLTIVSELYGGAPLDLQSTGPQARVLIVPADAELVYAPSEVARLLDRVTPLWSNIRLQVGSHG